jgi:tetratricopeptide (TPR) repeat protein
VAAALVNKGCALGRSGRWAEALGQFDRTVSQFGTYKDPMVRSRVALAMFNTGWVFSKTGRPEQALEAYESVLTRYGTDTDPAGGPVLPGRSRRRPNSLGIWAAARRH